MKRAVILEKEIRYRRIHFIFLLIIFLFIRIWTLFFSPDVFHEGELYRGTIAQEILEGVSWPLLLYQNEPHEGGSLVIGIVAALFFFIFGVNIFSLKAVSLTLAFISFIIFIAIINKYYGKRAVFLSGLIFVFSPPIYIIHSVITMGDYYELIFIQAVTLLLFFHILFTDRLNHEFKKISIIKLCVFGFLNGLAVYFSYAHMILLGTYFILIMRDKRFFFRRFFFPFSISFFVGFSPWLMYNINCQFRGLFVDQAIISKHFSLLSVIARGKELFSSYIPGAINIGVKWPLLSYFYFGFILIAIVNIVCLGGKRIFIKFECRDLELDRQQKIHYINRFLAIYLIAYIFIYSLSDFRSSVYEDYTPYKYLFPLFPFIFITMGILLNKLWGNKQSLFKYLAILSIIIIISPAMVFLYHISFNPLNAYLSIDKPYSYNLMGSNVIKFESDPIRQLYFIKRIKKNHILYAFRGFGNVLAEDFSQNPQWYKNNFFELIDKNYCSSFYLGLGLGLAERFHGELSAMINLIVSNIDSMYRQYSYKGIGIIKALDKDIVTQLIMQYDEANLPYFYKGVGIGIFNHTGWDKQRAWELVSDVEDKYRGYCYQGIDEARYFEEYTFK